MPLYTLSASSSLKFYGYEILSQTFIVNAVHKVQDIQNVHAKVFWDPEGQILNSYFFTFWLRQWYIL